MDAVKGVGMMQGKNVVKIILAVSLIINLVLGGIIVLPRLRGDSGDTEIETQEQDALASSDETAEQAGARERSKALDAHQEINPLHVGSWRIAELIPADFAQPSSVSGFNADGTFRGPETDTILNSIVTITEEYIECSEEKYCFIEGPAYKSFALMPNGKNRIGYHLAETLGIDGGYYTLMQFRLTGWNSSQPKQIDIEDLCFLYLKDKNTIYAEAYGGILYRLERVPDDAIYTTMRLDSFHTETMYDMFRFMMDPQETNLYMRVPQVFRFIEKDGKLVLKAMAHADWDENAPAPTEFWDIDSDDVFVQEYNSGEYCSKAISFLCDESAIKKTFNDYGVKDISNIVIIEFEPGYVVAAVTEQDEYYMTVPIVAEKYGDYIFQKIYTKDEFKKIYGPRPVKVFVNEKKVRFSSQPILGERAYALSERYYLEMDILELSEALGVRGTYDEAARTITVGDYVMRFENSRWWSIDPEYDEFIKSAPMFDLAVTTPEKAYQSAGTATYRNSRYLGSYVVIRGLCEHFGYQMEVDLEDYSIHIDKVDDQGG